MSPLTFFDSPEAARASLLQAIADTGGTVVGQDGGYIWAIYRTPIFRFTDDLECRIDAAAKVIYLRSASRTGHSDLGVNHRRVERLRAKFSSNQDRATQK